MTAIEMAGYKGKFGIALDVAASGNILIFFNECNSFRIPLRRKTGILQP